MAQPDNGHYAHSDGYRSDRGTLNHDRMMAEVADDLGPIAGVSDVAWDTDLDGPYIELEYDGGESTRTAIQPVVTDWNCAVTMETKRSLELRPE